MAPYPKNKSGTTAKGGGKPVANNDPYQQMLIVNPSKGLNNLISNNLIDDLESPDLMNIQYVEAGAPGKADGFTLAQTTASLPRGLGYFNDAPNSAKYLLTVDGTKLMNVLGNSYISGATFSPTGTIFMTEVDGSMAIWDGVNGGAQLASGGTLTRPGTMPAASFSIYWQSLHCGAGVYQQGQESRLYITGAQQFTATTATISPFQFTNASVNLNTTAQVPGATVFNGSGAQFIDVNPGDSDKITGLDVFQNNLIIFKERSIWQLTFTNGEPDLEMITQAYGCVSFKSLVRVDNDVFFLTRNGVYVLGYEPNYFAVIRTNELSARIHPIISAINPTNFQLATAMFHQYVYYLGIPSGSNTNNLTLTYDRRYQAWSQLNHIQAESFCVYDDINNVEYMYFTSSTTNQIFQITPNVYSANGAAIDSYWYSKSYDLGNFNLYKRWVDCAIFFRQLTGTVTVTFYSDNGVTAETFSLGTGTGTIGIGSDLIGAFFIGGDITTTDSDVSGSDENTPYRFSIGQKSRTMQVSVSNANINENFVVLGLAFRYRPYSSFAWQSAYKVYN